MASSLSISLAKVRAEAIRQAMKAVSEDEANHEGGLALCLGCRWRAALGEYADMVEHEADNESEAGRG